MGSSWGGATGRVNLIRDHAEEAERLTRLLSRVFSQEIERLKDSRQNDPETQELIDFLTVATAILDKIAESLQAAKGSESPKQKQENIERAETWGKSLATAAREFAERNRDCIVDGGGLITFVYLTTALFTSGLGVSSSVAFGGALAMFGLIKK